MSVAGRMTPSGGGAILRWLVGVVVFLGLPLGLGLWADATARHAARQQEIDRLAAGLRHRLSVIRRSSRTEEQLAGRLRAVVARAERRREPVRALLGGLGRLVASFPVPVSVAVLVGDEVASGPGLAPAPRQILRRLRPVVAAQAAWQRHRRGPPPSIDPRDWALIKAYLGAQARPPQLAASLLALQQVSYSPLRRWFASAVASSAVVFAHFDHDDRWASIGLIDRCRTARRQWMSAGEAMGVIEAGVPVDGHDRQLAAAYRAYLVGREAWQEVGGRLFVFAEVGAATVVWAAREMPAPGVWRWLVAGAALAIAGWGAWRSHRVTVGGEPLRIGVRWRLLVLFALAGGLPILLVIVASWSWLDQRFRGAVHQLEAEGIERLRILDEGFGRLQQQVENDLNRFAPTASFSPGEPRAASVRWLNRFWEQYGRPELVVIDHTGRTVWSPAPPRPDQVSARNSLISVGVSVLASLSGERSAPSFAVMMSDNNYLMADMAKSMGILAEMRIGLLTITEYMRPLAGRDSDTEYLLIMHWPTDAFEWRYLRRYLAKPVGSEGGPPSAGRGGRREPDVSPRGPWRPRPGAAPHAGRPGVADAGSVAAVGARVGSRSAVAAQPGRSAASQGGGAARSEDASRRRAARGGSPEIRPAVFAMATDRYDRRMPPVSPWYGHLWEIHQEAALTGAQVHQLWRRFGEDWLLTALVPKRLSRVLLTSVVPLRPASELVASGRRWLWAFVAVASLVSLTLAGLIARGLLWPLAAVGGGVAAIARRDFAHRVPVVASDELGQLGELFNQVLAGMADLEVAQTVQASLFPSATVEAGGVRVYGSTRPMTQLGGDYFDLSVLPDGRLLLLIGDVSGHGVPAALVMTMAKALVTARVRVHAGAQLLTPADVLRFLQQHLFRAARLRGMLTCLVAIHDPVRQCLDLANAGHAHPCRFRPGSPPSLLPLPASLPLAPRRRATFVTHEVPVLAGDRLLFYTDGLIEAHAADGQPLGYDRPFAAADALIDDDPVASCERLWAWERRQTAGAPPEDDITLLLLSRPAGGGECPRAATDGERSAGGGFE